MNNITLTLTKTGTLEQINAVALAHGWDATSGITSAEYCINYYSEIINRDLITVLLKPLVAQQEADREMAGNMLVEGLKTKTTTGVTGLPEPIVPVDVTPTNIVVDPIV